MLATLPDPTRTTTPPDHPLPPEPSSPPPSPSAVPPGALVARAATGDDRAFAVLVRRHETMLRAVVGRILDGTAEVDDVVQETFLAAWLRMADLVEGDAIAGWLATTARRRSYDRLRAPDRRRRAELRADADARTDDCPDAVAERAAMVSVAERLLGALPHEQRRCWELRHLGRRSYREIADAVGLPESTVRGQIARARAAIRSARPDWR
ncbi:RNA polymerase sigma factor [Curtobacterium citreum]